MKAHIERPLVYIAGPYSGEAVGNTHNAIKVAERLEQTGLITACVPHLNMLWDFLHQHSNEFWYDFDLAFLVRCDALLRMPGQSVGADDEVDFAEHNGIQVFYDENEVIVWATGYTPVI
jgi:hypothetical protein